MIKKLTSSPISLPIILLLLNYNHLLSKRIVRDSSSAIKSKVSLLVQPESILNEDNADILEEQEKKKEKEEWRKRELTSSEKIDLAAQTAAGAGLGYLAGSAIYTTNTTITTSAASSAAAALTTVAEATPAVANALLVGAKAITAAAAAATSAPVVIGGGMIAGGGLGFYWAWKNWKQG